jgi:hypothetical protein
MIQCIPVPHTNAMLPIFHEVPDAAKDPNVKEVMAFRFGVPAFCVKFANGIVTASSTPRQHFMTLQQYPSRERLLGHAVVLGDMALGRGSTYCVQLWSHCQAHNRHCYT